jgi:hypothetical protein
VAVAAAERDRGDVDPFMWFFLVAGAFMRANSLFGLPPLIDLALSATSRRWAAMSIVKRAAIVCVFSLAVAPAHILADRNIFRVEDIKPMSQLQVFDLGGMTHFSGKDRFQGFFGPNFVAGTRLATRRGIGTFMAGWSAIADVPRSMATSNLISAGR